MAFFSGLLFSGLSFSGLFFSGLFFSGLFFSGLSFISFYDVIRLNSWKSFIYSYTKLTYCILCPYTSLHINTSSPTPK